MQGTLMLCSARFHPFCRKKRPLIWDDNGITGPDWGLSELVFVRILDGVLSAGVSLSVTIISGVLVSSTISTAIIPQTFTDGKCFAVSAGPDFAVSAGPDFAVSAGLDFAVSAGLACALQDPLRTGIDTVVRQQDVMNHHARARPMRSLALFSISGTEANS